jgi:hypothetical protein
VAFQIIFQPIIGFGLAFHFLVPAMEIVVGPFVIRFGDSEWIRQTLPDNEDD